MKNLTLKNHVVVITGGAGLLGQEFVKAVILNSGIAVIADLDDVTGKKVQASLMVELKTNNIYFQHLDINSKKSIQSMIKKIHKKFGRIDSIVNNAYPKNRNFGRDFFNVSYRDFCENINLNLGGYFLVSQQFASYFMSQKRGNIINISSIYGVVPPKFEIYNNTSMTLPIEYAAIKSALIHITKYMANFFSGLNIRVNSISPGGILDDQPATFLKAYREKCLNKGMLDKSDLSGTLVFLLSDMSRYVNGQNIIVDDGFTIR